jgi:hypothetical protein
MTRARARIKTKIRAMTRAGARVMTRTSVKNTI